MKKCYAPENAAFRAGAAHFLHSVDDSGSEEDHLVGIIMFAWKILKLFKNGTNKSE